MPSITEIRPKERYRLLRKRVKELDHGSFNRFLETAIERSESYVSQITNGVRNFSAEEITLICMDLGLRQDPETIIKYFPPLGLEADEDYLSRLIDQRLAAKFGGQP